MKRLLLRFPFAGLMPRRLSTVVRLLVGGLALSSAALSLQAQRMALPDASASPVVIETASVATEVTGRYAVTTFDLVFRNPNNRVLEGTFEFPLLDGQNVTRFALDIGGSLREAVPVEKEKGRVAFEEIARRGVDPALLEQTAGNNYRARVFPLPARGTRRIVIAYQEALRAEPDGSTKYRLPLALGTGVAHFDLTAAVHSAGSAPVVARTTLPLDLPAWDERHTMRITRNDFAAQGVFELSLPKTTGETVITQRLNGREYFSAEVPLPEFPKTLRPAPKVVGLLWDASGSGRNRDHALEFAFLDAWLGAVDEVEVRLVLLRDTAAKPASFRVEHGEWTALRRALEACVYDGATSVDGLARDPAVDEWLLFSEGVFNYGTSDRADVLRALAAPIHAVPASAGSDTAMLRAISRKSGGRFADLMVEAPALAARHVREMPLRLWAVEHEAVAVAHLFPEPGSEVAPGRLEMVGVLRRATANLRLRIGTSEREAREVVVDLKSGTGAGKLAAQAWATAKINALSVEAERNRADIRRTAQDFGIVTAEMSLIVLETAADYALYDIEPPADLRREWKALRWEQSAALAKDRDAHLDAIAAEFSERAKWWEASPAKHARLAKRTGRRSAAERPVLLGGGGAVTPPMPTGGNGGGGGNSETEEVVVLSPFEISSSTDSGYRATDTLAGTRIRTELRDVASSISVVTPQLLRDVAASGSGELLTYTANTAVDGGRAPGARPVPAIALKAWSSSAGYLDHLQRTEVGRRYEVYLEERMDHERDAGFFADVGGFFLEQGETALGLRVLSNLAELELENSALLRILGYRLMQARMAALAVPLFERVLKLRGEEPQSRRDLALACVGVRQFQRAVDLLWEVVEKPWHNRFPGIELLALGELNEIAATCGEQLDLAKVDARLRGKMPVGLRVVLTWDADNCDIDLWVDDPDGERAYYGNRRTAQGGMLSCDFTGGYGPEEFMLRKPKAGTYTVRINYFGDRRTTALAPVTAHLRLITGYGTREQKEEQITVRLDSESKILEVGSIEVGKEGGK